MKMKKFLKMICIAMVMVMGITGARINVYADGVSTRTILRYESTGMSDSGRIKVFADLTVQDSSNTIIDYTITKCVGILAVSNINVVSSCITSNGTQVFVDLEYYYGTNYCRESVYINI